MGKNPAEILFPEETITQAMARMPAIITEEFAPVIPKVRPKPKAPCPVKKEEEYLTKNLETMCRVRHRIPFDLFIKPNEITGRPVPYVPFPQDKTLKANTKEKEDRHSRYNVVMHPPAMNLNKIEDQKVYDMVIEDMYTSAAAKSNKDALEPEPPVKAPMPEEFWKFRRIYPPSCAVPAVAREWRMESVSWDRRQMRAHCDRAALFWKDVRNLDSCPPCQQTSKVQHLRSQRLMP